MTVSRVPFQPICAPTDHRVGANNNIGSLRIKDLKLLLISWVGLKALANLSLVSIHWNHLVADDRVWKPMAARLGCPLQEGVPFYRQVVLFMQNVRDKLVFIDRLSYLKHNPDLFSPLRVLTQTDLDNENEERKPFEPDQAQKRARLENPQSDEETPTLRGLTVNQTRFLHNLKSARDILEVCDYMNENRVGNIPDIDWCAIIDVQTLFTKAEEFNNWFKSAEINRWLELNYMFLEPFAEIMQDEPYFGEEMLNDPAKRNEYIVENFLHRNSNIPSPEWIKEYADLQILRDGWRVTFPKELALFQQLKQVTMQNIDNVEVLEELDQLPNLEVLSIDFEGSVELPGFPKENKMSNRLRELSLRGVYLKEIPKEIGKFTLLQKLDLAHNNISHLPEELFGLTQLKELSLCNNQLSFLPERIERLSSLKDLDISNNNITVLPRGICELFSSLVKLNLGHNQFHEWFYFKFSEQIREVIKNEKLEGENLALFKEKAREAIDFMAQFSSSK